MSASEFDDDFFANVVTRTGVLLTRVSETNNESIESRHV
jgi:hypothetical protein